MITSQEDAAQFREECLKWQKRLNLLHWTLTFKAEEKPDSDCEALCDYDCDTREAVLSYYIGVENVSHPKDNALHEMLHLLLADMNLAGVEATDEEDRRLQREEHKVIAILEKVLR